MDEEGRDHPRERRGPVRGLELGDGGRRIRTWEASMEKRGKISFGPSLGDLERWFFLAGGGSLLAYGFIRRSLAGLFAAALGGNLIYLGFRRHRHRHTSL